MKSNFYLLVLLCIGMVSCKDRTEIRRTLETVYKENPELYQTQNLSEELVALLNEARAKDKIEDDTAHLGQNLLSGKCGEFTSFEIEKIGVQYNKAFAWIRLHNDHCNTEWTDTVKLVYQKRWKLDDVFYFKKKKNPSLKSTLTRFTKS